MDREIVDEIVERAVVRRDGAGDDAILGDGKRLICAKFPVPRHIQRRTFRWLYQLRKLVISDFQPHQIVFAIDRAEELISPTVFDPCGQQRPPIPQVHTIP